MAITIDEVFDINLRLLQRAVTAEQQVKELEAKLTQQANQVTPLVIPNKTKDTSSNK